MKYCQKCKKKLPKGSWSAKICRQCYIKTLKGSGNPCWRGGLPNCEICGKKLVRREFKRCPSCSKLKNRNGSWIGGKIKQNGYVKILTPKHPNAINGYVSEHRLVAEKILNRYLKSTEIIHHINEIKSDNRPKNLYLFANIAKHRSYHMSKNKQILKSNLFI